MIDFYNCSSEEFYVYIKNTINNVTDDLPSYLDFLSNFSETFPLNPAFIYAQNPEATMVCDSYTWEMVYNRKVVDVDKPIIFIESINKTQSEIFFLKGYDISQTEGNSIPKKDYYINSFVKYDYTEDDFIDNCVMYVTQKILSRDINLKYESIPEYSIANFNKLEFVLMYIQEKIQNTLINSSDYNLSSEFYLKTLFEYASLYKKDWKDISKNIVVDNPALKNGFLKLFLK